MPIVKATEPMPVRSVNILIYGQPGIGKTSLAFSASRPLLLDFDQGAGRSGFRGDTLVIEKWDDVGKELTPETLKDYDTIVIDTVSTGIDFMFEALAQATPKLKSRVGPTRDGWGAMKTSWAQFINSIRTYGKDLVLIAHDKEDKEKEPPRVRPNIIGGSYDFVVQSVDFVGFMSMGAKNRTLDFNPNELWIGKNAAGLPPLEVPSLIEEPNYFASVIGQMKERIGAVSERQREMSDAVTLWKDTVDTWETPEDFNKAFDAFTKLGAPLKQIVGKAIKAKREALNIDYDAEKGFVWKEGHAPADSAALVS